MNYKGFFSLIHFVDFMLVD